MLSNDRVKPIHSNLRKFSICVKKQGIHGLNNRQKLSKDQEILYSACSSFLIRYLFLTTVWTAQWFILMMERELLRIYFPVSHFNSDEKFIETWSEQLKGATLSLNFCWFSSLTFVEDWQNPSRISGSGKTLALNSCNSQGTGFGNGIFLVLNVHFKFSF